MSKKESVIYVEYFGHTDDYAKKFGTNTIVMMQVGSFMEVYGLKDPKSGEISGSQIEKYAEICGLNIAEKTHQFRGKTVLMCGFRDYCLDSYLTKLMEYTPTFTLVVFMQDESTDTDRKTRSLYAIYSPGTYVSPELTPATVSNFIMSIWLEPFTDRRSKPQSKQVMYGMAVCNIFTGKTHFYEYQSPNILLDNNTSYTTALDELEQFATAFRPNEILINCPTEFVPKIPWVLKRIGITTQNVRTIVTDTDMCSKNCQKQQYVEHVLDTFFGANTYQTCNEFMRYAIGTQAFVYLLNYIKEHNAIFEHTLELPPFTNLSDTLILANHSIEQLHILGPPGTTSVLTHIDKCKTPMGHRHLQYQLLHPTCDKARLTKEYRAIKEMLLDITTLYNIRELIASVYDVEKIAQQIALAKIHPSGIGHLYRAVFICIQVLQVLHQSNKTLYDYILGNTDVVETSFSQLLHFLDTQFTVSQCKGTVIESTMFATGTFTELDTLIETHRLKYDEFCGIRSTLNRMIWKIEGEPENGTDYVKEHKTNVHGYSLIITPSRSTSLKKVLDSATLPVTMRSLRVQTKSGASNYEIRSEYLDMLNNDIMALLDKIQKMGLDTYKNVLKVLSEQWFSVIKAVASILCRVDFLQSRAFVAHKYRYCCPDIDTMVDGPSYVDAHELRHCLIEQLNQQEIYVSNDLSLASDKSMLLYGTNMVGKTSLIRALGISVILAQSGMFVPCTSFRYNPFRTLYTRILGNDNLHNGLSTLGAEMVELREILHYADHHSLVLGDEVCKGTEMESALSIFAAALTHLHIKNVSYIFATHFHAILDFEEIGALIQSNKLRVCHMSVHYDSELDCLVYDRILKDGGGARSYGLEVCKSLHMPRDFIDTAYSIRNRYFTESRGELRQPVAVSYNSNKIRGKCEICGIRTGEEIHHLLEQRYADTDGFIGTVHKNHGGNLVSICEECHTKMHSTTSSTASTVSDLTTGTKKRIVRKKTTTGYRLLET
jgi:DNA mismatch repair protein MutS